GGAAAAAGQQQAGGQQGARQSRMQGHKGVSLVGGEGLAQLLELLLPGAGGVRGGRGGPCQQPGGVV
ncbi:hypothetical protein LOD54_11315, partial [Xylella fastidiosa subsp. multiplex]|uniref:hypothetical protein n=1 Tax=Xylella fastidiosa TaxID=2371 RepID=UPI0020C52376